MGRHKHTRPSTPPPPKNPTRRRSHKATLKTPSLHHLRPRRHRELDPNPVPGRLHDHLHARLWRIPNLNMSRYPPRRKSGNGPLHRPTTLAKSKYPGRSPWSCVPGYNLRDGRGLPQFLLPHPKWSWKSPKIQLGEVVEVVTGSFLPTSLSGLIPRIQ